MLNYACPWSVFYYSSLILTVHFTGTVLSCCRRTIPLKCLGYFKHQILNFMRERSWDLTFCFAFGISAVFKPGHSMLYNPPQTVKQTVTCMFWQSHAKMNQINADHIKLSFKCNILRGFVINPYNDRLLKGESSPKTENSVIIYPYSFAFKKLL